jgi:hypothetical protein
MADTKETYTSGSKPVDHAIIEDVSLKRDEAAIATAEEHSLSMKDALLNNKRILWWCFFYAMSAIGWHVDTWLLNQILSILLTIDRGFDAQVNGAMISVPQFRQNFGYGQMSIRIPIF